MDNPIKELNYKQKAFVNEFVKTKNGTKSYMKVYQPKNEKIARANASRLIAKDSVKKSIDYYLLKAGYNPINSINNLIDIEQSATTKITGSDKIKASELLLKLSNMLNNKTTSYNLNVDIDSMSYDKLDKINNKYNKIIKGKIINEK